MAKIRNLTTFEKARPGDIEPGTQPFETLGRVNPLDEAGVGGTAVYGGFIEEKEKDATVKGTRKYQTYSDLIANVTIVAAAVRFYLNLIAKAEWKVEASEADESGEFAERVEAMMEDMETPWHRIVRRLAMFRFYGFAVMEWIASRDEDGTIVMKDVRSRPQLTIEQWFLDRGGRVMGCLQRSPQTFETIPIPRAKMIYVVDDSINDSPEGLGLFRHVVESCHRLRRLQQLEGYGYESDLRGIPVGRAPLVELEQLVRSKKITKAKADEMIEGLDKFIKNHIKNPSLGILLDSTPYKQTGENRTPSSTPQWGLELLDGGTYGHDSVHNAIMRIIREVARVLGVEHLLLGEGSAASRSLADNKSTAFHLIVDSTLKEIRVQVEKDYVDRVWELNGWDDEMKPKLKTETLNFQDAEQLASVLASMATAGIQLDRQDEAIQELFDILGLTRLAPLEEMDPDMLLSSRQSQEMAMEIAGAKEQNGEEGEDDEDEGPRPNSRNTDEDAADEDDDD